MADLFGRICLNKRLLRHPVWQRDPVSYGQAWVDLLLRANDRERTTTLHGEALTLKRGQLAWSLRSLEKEWTRSGEWIERFMKFCRDETMITVQSTRRHTIITILNYDIYNPPLTGTDTVSEPGTDTVSEPGTDTVSEPERNKETGIGNRKGEAPTPDFAEVPTDEAVGKFCAEFTDPARGISGIPEGWWRGWLANRLTAQNPFPKNWQRVLVLAFTADFANRHPKAMAPSRRVDSAQPLMEAGEKQKNAAAVLNGRSLPQARFELSKELEIVQGRLDAAYQNGSEPSTSDQRRERELLQVIASLETGGGE